MTEGKRARCKRRRARILGEIAAYKARRGCADCRERRPRLLTFDHRDPATKAGVVAQIAHTGSKARAWLEIAKCDVRCVACHRRRHGEGAAA